MKAWIILGLTLASGSAVAGLFGPNNYEECVLDNMKGVTSNVAAIAIARACRAKFPAPPPPLPTNEEIKECWDSYDKKMAEYNKRKADWEATHPSYMQYQEIPPFKCHHPRPQ